MSRSLGPALVLVGLLALPACREVALALGSGSSGPLGASDFLVALATRFGPIERGAGFDAARPRLARAALVPSRVFDAKDLWTTTEGDTRQLEFLGTRDADRYRIELRPSAPPPAAVGDYRGRVRLRHVDDGRFEWTVRDELCVGRVRPADLSRALTALLRAGESVSGEVARLRARETFPRAIPAFSRLFDLETLDLQPSEGGSTAVVVGLRLRPDRLRETAPRYAAFLDRYASPIRLGVVATDATGDTWWAFETVGKAWTLRLRVRDGSLVPLSGPSERRVPDRLRLTIDYATKEGIFTIGVRSLVADVDLTREPQEKAFVARFVQEPDWRLPFLIKPLIRGSLRYPFEEEGMTLGFALRRRPDEPTRFVRDYRIRVQESWIIRWLGGLSDKAVSDFRRGPEGEADRFNRECLFALRDDVVTVLNEGGLGPGPLVGLSRTPECAPPPLGGSSRPTVAAPSDS